jgi:hypothetical protein
LKSPLKIPTYGCLAMAESKRGTNPNTRRAVAKANLKRKVIRLKDELATIAKTESDQLFVQSPKLLQVIFLLQEIGETENCWSDRANELVEELQSLIVEHNYQEAALDGTIQVGGAYILKG